MSYLFRRLVHAVFLLVGVSLLSFAFFQLAPGDFLSEMRMNPQISSQTLSGLRAQYGMDQPLPTRYWRWLKSAAGGDLGFSFAYNSPVAPIILARAKNTLLLTALAACLAWMIAIPLGVWSAAHQGKMIDRLGTAATAVVLAIPELLVAFAFLLLALRLRWLPVGGMTSNNFADLPAGAKLWDVTLHLGVPLTVLVIGSLPVIIRHVRATMIETLHTGFASAARAHGIPPQRLLFRHLLPAASNPLISLFALSVAGLLSASLLVEVIMSWPGLGPLMLEAVLARDVYLVIGITMFSTLLLVAAALLADVMLLFADPRIRTESAA
jgi:peptide/nickel transport system permease protein